jgi:hypothetical protein
MVKLAVALLVLGWGFGYAHLGTHHRYHSYRPYYGSYGYDGGYYMGKGYETWGTPPNGPHTICTPIDKYTLWGRYAYTRPDMPGYACRDFPG